MNIESLLERIENERKNLKTEIYNEEGVNRLKETMAAYDGEYQLVWSDKLLEEIKARPVVPANMTGIPSLDELTGGFRPKQLITVAAHSKHGKTAMGLFMLHCLKDMNPLMIPIEQSNEELVEQRDGNGQVVPLFLSPRTLAPRVTTEWIEERVVEGIVKHNTRFVLIDHLGYLDDFGKDGAYKRENHSYRIERLMQELKFIAKKWDITIMILVHIVKTDEGKPPSLEDLKGSQSILGESDKVIAVWRKNALKKKVRIYEDKSLVSVLANRRNGRNGHIGLTFDVKTGLYIEDNSWVQSMVEAAEREAAIDDQFDD